MTTKPANKPKVSMSVYIAKLRELLLEVDDVEKLNPNQLKELGGTYDRRKYAVEFFKTHYVDPTTGDYIDPPTEVTEWIEEMTQKLHEVTHIALLSGEGHSKRLLDECRIKLAEKTSEHVETSERLVGAIDELGSEQADHLVTKQKLADKENECNQKEGELNSLSEQLHDYDVEVEKLKAARKQAEELAEQRASEIGTLKTANALLEESKTALTNERDTLVTQKGELEKEVNGLKPYVTKFNELTESHDKSKLTLERTKKQLDESLEKADALRAADEDRQEQFDRLSEELSDEQDSVTRLSEELDEAKKREIKANKARVTAENSAVDLRAQVEKLTTAASDAQKAHEKALKDIQKQLEDEKIRSNAFETALQAVGANRV
ncbi:hypothetical protein [Vibrio mediterranei]|uniref:hypothetical protein n=1 Tax=Vibrio mediterranei TaxID=689 RepID=UPI00406929BD